MKHSYLILIALTLMLNQSYGQSPEKANMSKENIELLRQLDRQEQARLARVQAYLKKNPKTITSKKDGINFTQIYDIVDGVVLYRSTNNLNAGRATKTSHLQVGGDLELDLDGTGMTVGVWDGGPADLNHPEFQNSDNSGSRINVVDFAMSDDDPGEFSGHATHVSGTIAAKGVFAEAKGMATNINVNSYNWTNDYAEMISAANATIDPIVLSNHSYGVPVSSGGETIPAWYMGAYTQDARNIDQISKNNPKYLIVASAGNSGTTIYTGGMYSGYDKLTTDKNAKNNLVIANASPVLSPFIYDLEAVNINTGSSQGPTDDLRIKPDIAADGTNVKSSVPGGGYAEFSGTSMSAPNTTGTLALLQQYYKQLHGEYMNSSTLRGLVCHTSVDDYATPGPDPKFGWGFLDARASAETILDAQNNTALLDELNLAQGETYTMTFTAQEGDKLKATIAWTDMPGIISNGTLNDPTPRLVNDLDLRLTKDGNTYFPWKLDYSASSGFSNSKGDNTVDNIEIVEIEAPSSGVYTLTVSHKGTLKGNAGDPLDPFFPQTQDFSLIVTGNNITLSTQDNLLSNSLVVYPNPNKGEFTISFDSSVNNSNDIKVDIYDVSGRLVYKNVFVNDSAQFNKTINLNGVASGIYVANISQGNNTSTQKIIIE